MYPIRTLVIITGLDPAGPGYSNIPESDRLDAGDAKLVDVIHTFAKVLSLAQPQGHVDFYPNGGRLQPGCPNIYDVCEYFSLRYKKKRSGLKSKT